MRWSFDETWAKPAPFLDVVSDFVNKHVLPHGGDLDDLE
jgi:hypothetical protein